MDDDDDLPPLLVSANRGDPSGGKSVATLPDDTITKVPITIITGRIPLHVSTPLA